MSTRTILSALSPYGTATEAEEGLECSREHCSAPAVITFVAHIKDSPRADLCPECASASVKDVRGSEDKLKDELSDLLGFSFH